MQILHVLILSLDHNTSWHKRVIEKYVLSNQIWFLSCQNLSLAGQMTKIICRLDIKKKINLHVHVVLLLYAHVLLNLITLSEFIQITGCI